MQDRITKYYVVKGRFQDHYVHVAPNGRCSWVKYRRLATRLKTWKDAKDLANTWVFPLRIIRVVKVKP